MRRFDKISNIEKANILAEQRYLISKGLINENENPKPIGKFGNSDLYYKDKKFVILNGDTNKHQLKYIVFELKNNNYTFVYHTDNFEDALEFVGPKKSLWTTKILPKVKEILSKIDAPIEWKNTIIKCEKIEYAAKNALNRGMSLEKIYVEFGDKWNELMKHTGNPQVAQYSSSEPNDKVKEEYWSQYCELRGLNKFHGFDDIIA